METELSFAQILCLELRDELMGQGHVILDLINWDDPADGSKQCIWTYYEGKTWRHLLYFTAKKKSPKWEVHSSRPQLSLATVRRMAAEYHEKPTMQVSQEHLAVIHHEILLSALDERSLREILTFLPDALPREMEWFTSSALAREKFGALKPAAWAELMADDDSRARQMAIRLHGQFAAPAQVEKKVAVRAR